jgi:hypothetical protein
MPILPEISDFDLEMINLLIKKEREEQNAAHERPFLQLPIPGPPENPEFYEELDEKQNNNEIIIIDL